MSYDSNTVSNAEQANKSKKTGEGVAIGSDVLGGLLSLFAPINPAFAVMGGAIISGGNTASSVIENKDAPKSFGQSSAPVTNKVSSSTTNSSRPMEQSAHF